MASAQDFINFLNKAMAPLKTRVQLMVGRAVLMASKDSGGIQTWQIQGLEGETFDGVPRVQEFGFSSNPPKGTDAIMVAVGGSRESLVVIATDHKTYRFKNLETGESVLYTSDGTHIHLKKDGQIEIKTATKVTIDTADVEITGNLKVAGTSNLVGKVTADDEIEAAKDISTAMNVKAAIAVQTPLVQAGAYSGPAGGAPGVNTTEPIVTSSTVTASNVTGGGTDMATLKSAHNTHTHNGVQSGSSNSGGPSATA